MMLLLFGHLSPVSLCTCFYISVLAFKQLNILSHYKSTKNYYNHFCGGKIIVREAPWIRLQCHTVDLSDLQTGLEHNLLIIKLSFTCYIKMQPLCQNESNLY